MMCKALCRFQERKGYYIHDKKELHIGVQGPMTEQTRWGPMIYFQGVAWSVDVWGNQTHFAAGHENTLLGQLPLN